MSVYERGVKVVSFDEVYEQEIMSLAVRLSFKEESNESDVGLTFPPKVDGGPFSWELMVSLPIAYGSST